MALAEILLADAPALQIDVPSSWHQCLPPLQEAAAQTNPTKCKEAAVQSSEGASRGTQTDSRTKSYLDALRGQSKERSKEMAMAQFLRRVLPLIEVAMAENCTSTAFSSADLEAAREPARVELSQTLTAVAQAFGGGQLCCTCVSWSSTGQSIAVACGRFDIQGWCSQPGLLAVWNLARSGLDPSRPGHALEVDTCLQCCSYHPEHPALIAGGTFNGQLCIWDLGRPGDPHLGTSSISEAAHQEPVTAIRWQYSTEEAARHSGSAEAFRVITLASDGRVLVWLWHRAQVPVLGFELTFRHPDTHQAVLWGGTCLALHGHDVLTDFVAGSEGGAVFRCVLAHSETAEAAFSQTLAAQQKPQLRSCIRATLQPHIGPVHAVHCSPFQHSLYLSCGADGCIFLGSTLQRRPALELQPCSAAILCGAWSPVRPLVFAVGTGDGRLLIYDLLASTSRPAVRAQVSSAGRPVYALAFCDKAPQVLAVTCNNTVVLWKLNSSLQQMRSGEAALAQKFAADTASGEGDPRKLLSTDT